MKVTEEGTTNIIKWYQPESIEECNTTDCAKCIFHRYVDEGVSCQFKLYLTHPPVRKPTDTDEQLKTIQNRMRRGLILGTPDQHKKAVRQMAESCKIIDSCEQLQNEKLEQQIEPLQNMINVLDLIIEIEDKQDRLTKMRQEPTEPKPVLFTPNGPYYPCAACQPNKPAPCHEWKLVKVYECPDCGEWVQDMDDACCHVCKQADVSK